MLANVTIDMFIVGTNSTPNVAVGRRHLHATITCSYALILSRSLCLCSDLEGPRGLGIVANLLLPSCRTLTLCRRRRRHGRSVARPRAPLTGTLEAHSTRRARHVSGVRFGAPGIIASPAATWSRRMAAAPVVTVRISPSFTGSRPSSSRTSLGSPTLLHATSWTLACFS